MVMLTIAFLMGCSTHITGLSSAAIFYFSWGAFMSLNKKNMGVELSGYRADLLGYAMLLALGLFTYGYFTDAPWTERTKTLYILSVVFCLFGWSGRYVKKDIIQIPAMLSTASFFIFAFHKPMQVIVRRLFFSALHPTQEWLLTLAVFLIPTVVILIALGVFYLIKRYMPFLKFLNGFRM